MKKKVCNHCNTIYSSWVEFCFRDGEVLIESETLSSLLPITENDFDDSAEDVTEAIQYQDSPVPEATVTEKITRTPVVDPPTEENIIVPEEKFKFEVVFTAEEDLDAPKALDNTQVFSTENNDFEETENTFAHEDNTFAESAPIPGLVQKVVQKSAIPVFDDDADTSDEPFVPPSPEPEATAAPPAASQSSQPALPSGLQVQEVANSTLPVDVEEPRKSKFNTLLSIGLLAGIVVVGGALFSGYYLLENPSTTPDSVDSTPTTVNAGASSGGATPVTTAQPQNQQPQAEASSSPLKSIVLRRVLTDGSVTDTLTITPDAQCLTALTGQKFSIQKCRKLSINLEGKGIYQITFEKPDGQKVTHKFNYDESVDIQSIEPFDIP